MNSEIHRFMSHVQRARDCWFWRGALDIGGYGRFRRSSKVGGHTDMAHRYSYEYFIRKIPKTMQLDHLCAVRNCVNPYHLEVVTNQQNIQRGFTARGGKKHCPNGHRYSGDNLYVAPNNNGIGCRICRSKQTRAYKKRVNDGQK